MKQKLIHVHASAEEIGKVYQPDLGIVSGIESFCESLSTLEPLDSESWQNNLE